MGRYAIVKPLLRRSTVESEYSSVVLDQLEASLTETKLFKDESRLWCHFFDNRIPLLVRCIVILFVSPRSTCCTRHILL